METDVVCGMRVEPSKAAGRTVHDGRTYYFCSRGCLHRFETDPKKYLDPAYRPGMHAMHAAPAPLTHRSVSHGNVPHGTPPHGTLPHRRGGPSGPPASPASPAAPAAPDAREYTCPMHPEIRQRGPGSCPICGMALEPVEVSVE